MGPRSQGAIADGQDAILRAIGHLTTEARHNRVLLQRIAAKLDIEIEDRTESDESQGRWLSEHERKINRLELVKVGAAE